MDMDVTHQQFAEAVHAETLSLKGFLRGMFYAVANPIADKFLRDRMTACVVWGEGFVAHMDEFEAEHCESCDVDCGMSLKADIAALVDGLLPVIEQYRQLGGDEALLCRAEELLDRLDDKLENYAFAADTEMRDLVRRVSDKLNSDAKFCA